MTASESGFYALNSTPEQHEGSVELGDPPVREDVVEMPNATAAPMVMAFGVTLALSSVVMHLAFAVVGFVIAVGGLVYWIRHLTPGAGVHWEEWVPESNRPKPVRVSAGGVSSIQTGMPGHRLRVPAEIYPYSAGLKGGLVGGAMMALTALAYGHFSGHGIWYPVNLLAAMVIPSFNDMSAEQFNKFHLAGLIVGTVIHVVTSIIVGLFFGIILPMCPRWPLLWGGLVAPLLWSGFVYGFMGVLNPVMSERVDWPWFFVSQFAFGITLGFVVMQSTKVQIQQVLEVQAQQTTDNSQHSQPDDS